MSRALGITDHELTELRRYEHSDAFTDVEKLVLDLAVAMTATPSTMTDELRDSLLEHFTPGQLAELASAIAWENHRARLNRALGVQAMGFSDDGFCVLPELHPAVDGGEA